jgi:hypothetical protein
VIDPKNFANPIGHFFPLTEVEKETASQAILVKLNVVPIEDGMDFQFIGMLPNGNQIFLIEVGNEAENSDAK